MKKPNNQYTVSLLHHLLLSFLSLLQLLRLFPFSFLDLDFIFPVSLLYFSKRIIFSIILADNVRAQFAVVSDKITTPSRQPTLSPRECMLFRWKRTNEERMKIKKISRRLTFILSSGKKIKTKASATNVDTNVSMVVHVTHKVLWTHCERAHVQENSKPSFVVFSFDFFLLLVAAALWFSYFYKNSKSKWIRRLFNGEREAKQ